MHSHIFSCHLSYIQILFPTDFEKDIHEAIPLLLSYKSLDVSNIFFWKRMHLF